MMPPKMAGPDLERRPVCSAEDEAASDLAVDADQVELGAHEHYQDAALYDYEYRRRADVNFYVDLASQVLGQRPGRVLELACGSGRLTVPLARAGHSVMGMDLSAPMLHRAADRLTHMGGPTRSRAAFVRADMRQFALGERFPLIVMAFNSFEHLYTRVDVSQCLERVREHLAPGGIFAFDVQNPHLPWLCRDPRKRWARTRFTYPHTGQRLVYSTNHDYDPISQIVIIRLYYEPVAPATGPTRVITLSQRKFFPAELEALLHANGFRVRGHHGDFAGEPIHGECHSQVLVCQVQPQAHAHASAQPGRPPRAAQAMHDPAAPASDPGQAEVVCRLGVVRDDKHLYYVKSGALWRMPHGQRQAAEKIAAPGLTQDPGYIYFLDHQGHLARVRRAQA